MSQWIFWLPQKTRKPIKVILIQNNLQKSIVGLGEKISTLKLSNKKYSFSLRLTHNPSESFSNFSEYYYLKNCKVWSFNAFHKNMKNIVIEQYFSNPALKLK